VLFGIGAIERKWGFLLGGDWYASVDANYPLIFFRGPDFAFSEDFRFAFFPLGRRRDIQSAIVIGQVVKGNWPEPEKTLLLCTTVKATTRREDPES
jgi:hypothetical protein